MNRDLDEFVKEIDKGIYAIKNKRYSPRKDDNLARYVRVETLEFVSQRLKQIIKKSQQDAITKTKG